MPFTYEYARPMVCTDIIAINKRDNSHCILLIKRLNAPFKNTWALPGGFVDENESLEIAALRELKEETSIVRNNLIQFKTYGDPGRDPRGHAVSIVYYFIEVNDVINAVAGDDAKETKWFPLNNLPELAFDHEKIIEEFIANLDTQK